MIRSHVGNLVLLMALAAAGGAHARGGDDEYTQWLESNSMLRQGQSVSFAISGSQVQWTHRYAEPRPREAVHRAPVWLLDYAGAVITHPGQSVIGAWGEPALWDALRGTGITALHTGPVSVAGGLEGRRRTPTTDGWFDRISQNLDPALGNEDDYMKMVSAAREHGGLIAGDLIPLHTGMGADFRLAERGHEDYPGMYAMVEIPEKDWGLLPKVDSPDGVAHILKPAAVLLQRKGYIPGWINSCDADPEAVKWSGWSATGPVKGDAGRTRRWVYLHYFKQTQPALNWCDPSFAAQRAIGGDVVRTVFMRDTPIVRLDAVPFLGIEKKDDRGETWHYMHPLSITGTNTIAFLVRKLGGFSFHELNVPFPVLKEFTKNGPDLSYDFFTRTQILHALLSGDARPLSLVYRWFLEADFQPIALVHDMQNHDEVTYQLTGLADLGDKPVDLGDEKIPASQLRNRMLDEMRHGVAGAAAPYNKLYRPAQDGVATTYAGFVAPAVGVRDPYHAKESELQRIINAHFLLAAANALQPGVFSLSSWDLVGALPLPEASVSDRTAGGDWRWVNRGGVDLLGANPTVQKSSIGLPRAQSLYGPLPQQLKNPSSFASQLKRMLEVRQQLGLAEATLVAAPVTHSHGVCTLVFRLPDHRTAITILNFGRQDSAETPEVPAGANFEDALHMGLAERRNGKTIFRVHPLTASLFVQVSK